MKSNPNKWIQKEHHKEIQLFNWKKKFRKREVRRI
jgi:hypothetical protein